MPSTPILLFLHGVGEGDPDDNWRAALEPTLTGLGYPDLSGVTVVAPKYAKGLNGVDDNESPPKLRVRPLRGDNGRKHRRAFERRRASMEIRLGHDHPGDGWPAVAHAAPLVTGRIEQANNYIKKPEIRAWVLNRIINKLPPDGRLVIVGHSLGSVIAADLVRRLPAELEVVGMVTIGSPLAHETLHVEPLRELLADPPANLGWWVNIRSTADPVSTGRGVSNVLPWVLDHVIRAPNPMSTHLAATYLRSDAVATAVGFALFGSQSKELAVPDTGLDVPLDTAETMVLLALRYAHLELNELEKGDRKDRYADALRSVQADAVERIRARRASDDAPMPAAIANLAVDLSDPSSSPPEPWLPGDLSREEAVVPLLAVGEANVIQPYEIEVSKEHRKRAMELLAFDMQLGTRFGTDVIEAMEEAREVLKPTNWMKWAALGLGSAALVAATGGLALAAAPGVAGAAAITSALAAFGPGGMIGGLLTAGTLVSAGGGGIAVGLAAPGTTVETAEAWVAAQLAAAILRDRQGLPQDEQTWSTLVAARLEVTQQLSRLTAVSDESAPTLKALERKLDAIDRALGHLRRKELKAPQFELEKETSRVPS